MFFSRIIRAALGRFRSSLKLRSLIYTVSLSGTALVVLGGLLSVNIGNNLFDTRTNAALKESNKAAEIIENHFSEANGYDIAQLNQYLSLLLSRIENEGVTKKRLVQFYSTDSNLEDRQLQSLSSQLWPENIKPDNLITNLTSKVQSITIQLNKGGQSVPGFLTGQLITLPGNHVFKLFLIYDLESEQQTLLFVQGILLLGGFSTLMIIGFFSYLVTGWLVKPMRVAAETSELIASGQLHRRLPVRGTDDVAILAASFNHMADSLQEKITEQRELSRMQQRFVADVSHELRTPLTSMRLSSEMILENKELLPTDPKRAAEILFETVSRLDSMLSDLLEISRYDAANVTLSFDYHDLNGLVGQALSAIQPLADSKGVVLQAQVASGSVTCEVDSRRVDRILNNLLANAIEHSEGKPVLVKVAQNDNAVAVSVIDNGVGMTMEQAKQVFDRFYRADPSRKRSMGGTGLGLAISLEDAKIHRGVLEVYAEPGVGSCFRLTLPKRQSVIEYVSPLPLAVEKLS
jgi:two-component system sensor histidine kinase MtrB